MVLKSVEVADAYQENQCQSLAREIRILNDDLTRARPNFDVNRQWFENFLTTRATALGLPVAEIMRGPNEVVARAKIDILKERRLPSAAAFEEAAKSNETICLRPSEGRIFAALLQMPAYDGAVLLVQREVSQLAVDFPGVLAGGRRRVPHLRFPEALDPDQLRLDLRADRTDRPAVGGLVRPQLRQPVRGADPPADQRGRPGRFGQFPTPRSRPGRATATSPISARASTR